MIPGRNVDARLIDVYSVIGRILAIQSFHQWADIGSPCPDLVDEGESRRRIAQLDLRFRLHQKNIVIPDDVIIDRSAIERSQLFKTGAGGQLQIFHASKTAIVSVIPFPAMFIRKGGIVLKGMPCDAYRMIQPGVDAIGPEVDGIFHFSAWVVEMVEHRETIGIFFIVIYQVLRRNMESAAAILRGSCEIIQARRHTQSAPDGRTVINGILNGKYGFRPVIMPIEKIIGKVGIEAVNAGADDIIG